MRYIGSAWDRGSGLEGAAGWARPDARRRGRGGVHGGAGGVAGSIGPRFAGGADRPVLVGGRRYSRVLRDKGELSPVEELMDDVIVLLASLSARL